MKNLVRFLLLLIGFLCIVYIIHDNYYGVERGDIWRYEIIDKSSNPFRVNDKTYFRDYKVLNIKSGYVQYMDIKDSSIGSSSIRYFKISSHKISKCLLHKKKQ